MLTPLRERGDGGVVGVLPAGEPTMTVPSCATLGVVSSTFGKELKRRRELLRLSRKSLETLSGVSESNISNLETRGTTPGRPTVIDLAGPLRWPVDKALKAAGQPPLHDDELAMLARPIPTSPRDVRRELLRLINELSDARVRALLQVARTMVDPDAGVHVDLIPHDRDHDHDDEPLSST